MKLGGNTILITGGASGIGFALAKRLSAAGSQVIVCGRRSEQLAIAKRDCPALHTLTGDVSQEAGRIALFDKATKEFPQLNVLINNAGVQNRPPHYLQPQKWEDTAFEIAVNLQAPIHLAMLFSSYLAKKTDAAIVNVTSGLAFSPIAFMPVYCATKAALHSFTLSLRHQLADTSVKVIEVAPPAVQTDLGGKGLHDFGVPLDEFADYAIAQLGKGELEFGFGTAEMARTATREGLAAIFQRMNAKPA